MSLHLVSKPAPTRIAENVAIISRRFGFKVKSATRSTENLTLIADLVGWVDFMKPNLYFFHTTSAIALAKRGVSVALLQADRASSV